MVFRGAQTMKAVGQCKSHCTSCARVLPHHVVRRTRVARFARFSLFTLRTEHALICARCNLATPFTRPSRALALLAPLALLLAALM